MSNEELTAVKETLETFEKTGGVRGALDERRVEMLRLRAQGVQLSQVVKQLSVKHSVTIQALYTDWSKRARWGPRLIGLDDSESMIVDLQTFLNWLKEKTVLEILSGDSSSNRIGAIRTAKDIAKDIYVIAKDTGKIGKVPEAYDILIRWNSYDPPTNHKL